MGAVLHAGAASTAACTTRAAADGAARQRTGRPKYRRRSPSGLRYCDRPLGSNTRMTWAARWMSRDRHVGVARRRAAGQSLAEFSLILPIFLIVLMGVIEFALAFNALLNVNYASRSGGAMAAQAGNILGADCLILESIEDTLQAPLANDRVRSVEIQRTTPLGSVIAANVYQRGGSTTCRFTDGTTKTVPYAALSATYREGQRCAVLPPLGCPTISPPRTNVDNVGVQVTYDYAWITPLGAVMALANGTLDSGALVFVQRNVFRMEPQL